MAKLSIYNKLFIIFFILLVGLIIWKVPREKQEASAHTAVSAVND